jgi:RNA polymerase sigma-70 factor (ECF subfamily)
MNPSVFPPTEKKENSGLIDVEACYQKYAPMLLRRCRSFFRDEDSALDAMQDVFVNLIRFQHQLKNEYLSSLLYRMATNICLNKLRGQKRRSEVSDEITLQNLGSLDPELARLEPKELLEQIFANEDEETRVMAVMYYMDGMTLEEVGAEINLSISGVRKRLLTLQERAKQAVNHK